MAALSNRRIFVALIVVHLLLLVSYWLVGMICQLESSRFFYQLWISRFFLITTLSLALLLFFRNRNKLINEISSPLPLALLRIVFFSVFFIGGIIRFNELLSSFGFFVEFANAKNLPDTISSAFWSLIPYSQNTIRVALIGLIIAAFFSLVGFKTKFFIFLFAILAIYIFALPNLTGKINNNQDVFWIPLLLAFSGCGDIWSIDALIKLKSKRISNSLVKSPHYSMAIFTIWVMLGICYFFPGFWKWWNCGLDWALTENVKYQMYNKWFSLGHFTPFFRIDYYPLLYKAAGLITLWFELFFIFLLPFKKARKIGITGGLMLHLSIWIFMDIFFIFFIMSYLAFFNYDRIWEKVKNRTLGTSQKPFKLLTNAPLTIITVCLLGGFGLFGILRIDSWPFSCYPKFETRLSNTIDYMLVELCPTPNSCKYIDKGPVKEKYSPERLSFLENEILTKQGDTDRKLDEMMRLYRSVYYFKEEGQLRFVKGLQSINPDSSLLPSYEVLRSYNLSDPLK